MTMINIHEAKTHLSKYAQRVKAGETIILCERNVPIAEIRPLPQKPKGKKRPFGLFAGQIKMAKDFDAAAPRLDRAFDESELLPSR